MIDLADWIVKQEDKKSSRRLYKMTCDGCNKDRGYQRKSRHGLGLCKGCVSSFIHKNKVVSNKTKELMSKNHYLNNGGKSSRLGKRHSDETKAKLSKAATEQNKRYKGSHKYSGLNDDIGMRSSWEVKYAIWLDKQNISWEYEPSFELSNGKIYTPDFRLEDGTIVEIKGYFREDAMIKWKMFKKEYPKLKKSLLMKQELKDLGVL